MAYDPLAVDQLQNRRTVRLQTTVEEGALAGLLQFSFGGSNVLLNADASELDDFFCSNSMAMGLKSVSEIACQRESYDAIHRTGSYLITLVTYPQVPYLNNLVYHTGNPPLSLFECNLTRINSEDVLNPSCSLSDVITEDLPSYLPCGGHGICDQVKGSCLCHPGFKGKACEDTRDDQDLNVTVHHGPFFTGSLMKLQILRDEESSFSSNEAFNLFQARINQINVTTIRGDRALIHQGNVSVEGGSLVVKSHPLSPFTSSSSSSSSAQIQSHLSGPSDGRYHFLASSEGEVVFSVDHQGSTSLRGSLTIGEGQRAIQADSSSGHLSATSIAVEDSLSVQNQLEVSRGLSVAEGALSVTPEGISFTSSEERSDRDSLMQITAASPLFEGSLLSLTSQSERSVLLRSSLQNSTTFELRGNGTATMAGLKLLSGGIVVESGGVTVGGGGLSVRGGLRIESGELLLPHREMSLGSLDLSLSSEEKERSLIRGTAPSSLYSGRMISLAAPPPPPLSDKKRFSFLSLAHQTSSNEDKEVFEVDDRGFLTSEGGALFKEGRGGEGVRIASSLSVEGDLLLRAKTVVAQWSEERGEWFASLSTSSSSVGGGGGLYLTVMKPPLSGDQRKRGGGAIRLVFDQPQDSDHQLKSVGKVLLITNRDEEKTTGALAIPPSSTVLAVFNGERWIDVEALRAPMNHLIGVERLEASRDLSIGNVSFSAGKFQSTSLAPSSVIFLNKAQQLSEHRHKFFYSKGVLHVPGMKIDRLAGGFDGQGHDLQNLLLTNAKLKEASIQATDFSLSSPSLAQGGGGLAYFNSKGQLLASRALKLDEEQHLMISELHCDLDARDQVIKRAVIRESELQEISLATIAHLRLSSEPQDGGIIAVDGGKGGDLRPAPLAALRFNFTTGETTIASLSASTLTGPLNANDQEISHARITSSSFSSIKEMSVEQLVVESFQSREEEGGGSRLVYTDSRGRLMAYSTSLSEITIPNLAVSSLSFSSSSTPPSPHGWSPVMRVEGETGKVVADSSLLVNPSDGSLHLKALSPLTTSPSDRLVIRSPRIEGGEIEETAILSSPSISTQQLSVARAAEFQSEVTVMGSLAVYGSVSGAGPYIDTSDRRLKENIRPLRSALQLIDQLQAVRYDYKETEGFSFPAKTQIGWIAQEVQEVLPEIVFDLPSPPPSPSNHTTSTSVTATAGEETSYLSIAYSHACPVLAEGIKELHSKLIEETAAMKRSYEEKIASLEKEMEEMKEMIRQLHDLMILKK